MGDWKEYIILCFGEYVGHQMARSEKEAVKLYVEECVKRYKEEFGDEPTDDMIEDAYDGVEAIDISD